MLSLGYDEYGELRLNVWMYARFSSVFIQFTKEEIGDTT